MSELKNACKSLQKDIESIIKTDSALKETAKSTTKETGKQTTRLSAPQSSPAESKNTALQSKTITYLKSKDAMVHNSVKKSADQLSRIIWKEFDINIADDKRKKFNTATALIAAYDKAVKDNELKKAAMLLADIAEIDIEKKGVRFVNKIPFPDEIKEFMDADIDELEKTFNSGCMRSSIIICGRLLETALHRKFFEKTGTDILEKHPEIGLGKIIAKLEELNVAMPPGLTQQIHLINQARIHSVHKKKEVFLPSREQAYAVILFTIDVLKKLF